MLKPKLIYLDNAAATPVDQRVIEAMMPYFADKFYNPSATYLPAKDMAADIKMARASVAKWLGAKTSEVIFTAGGTEANNLAILGTARQYSGSEIISTAIEHESVLEPLNSLKKQGHKVKLVLPGSNGLVDPSQIAKNINDKTVLISVIYANNEIGTLQPLKQIAKVVQSVRDYRLQKGIDLPLYLHTDAAQAGNYLSLQVHRLGVDLMTLNGGKIYGPKQSGVLYVGASVRLQPLIYGGGQERSLRSGTENVANIVGFSKALDIAQNMRQKESERIGLLQAEFINLLAQKVPSAKINGSLKHRIVNNVHLTFLGIDNERLQMQLEEKNVLCGLGSACSASKEEPSYVLKAIGLSDNEAQSSLRFTMGRMTTASDIRYTVKTLAQLLG